MLFWVGIKDEKLWPAWQESNLGMCLAGKRRLQKAISIKELFHGWLTSSIEFGFSILHLTLAPSPAQESEMATSRPSSICLLSMRKSKQQFGSHSHCSEPYFPLGLLSPLFKANVYYHFAANMARDERFCHYFPYITNHKAALSHSLIASVSRLIVSNYQRHIRISSLCLFSSIPWKHLAIYSFLSTQTSVTLRDNRFHYDSSFIIHCNNLQLVHINKARREPAQPFTCGLGVGSQDCMGSPQSTAQVGCLDPASDHVTHVHVLLERDWNQSGDWGSCQTSPRIPCYFQ